MLAAEPKGQPGTIGSLSHSKELQSVSQIPLEEGQRETGEMNLATASRVVNLIRFHLAFPRGQSAKRMSGKISPASIKGKLAPPATEGWPAAIAVLQIEQPLKAILNRRSIFKG